MAALKLKNFRVESERGGYQIYWVCDDGENGATLGASCARHLKRPTRETSKSDADFEFDYCSWYANLHATQSGATFQRHYGWIWDSGREAKAFARLLEAELLSLQSKRPMPAWTKLALAAGWKPPKGWKP